jgi:hypothetical protein
MVKGVLLQRLHDGEFPRSPNAENWGTRNFISGNRVSDFVGAWKLAPEPVRKDPRTPEGLHERYRNTAVMLASRVG